MNIIIWIAGYLEGEGCFYFRTRRIKGSKGYRFKYTPLITVASTDRDVIIKVAQIWKSSVCMADKGKNKAYYSTVIVGKRAISWMMTIYPIMSMRRKDKIKEVIKQWKECRL